MTKPLHIASSTGFVRREFLSFKSWCVASKQFEW